jgi:NADH-quinone oxidoreductase subunit L
VEFKMSGYELFLHLTWALPYVGAFLTLILANVKKIKEYVAVIMLFIPALSSTFLLLSYLNQGSKEFSYLWVSSIGANLEFSVDGLSAFMAFLVAWLSFAIGFYSLKYMEGNGLLRYWFFFDFFVGSMLLLVLAGNLLTMFIGWEGTGLASYALIGHWYTDDRSWVGDMGRKALGIPMFFSPSHSGIRALVFTRIGDIGFIAGIGILLIISGTLNISSIAENSSTWTNEILSKGILFPFLIFFSLGAIAKSAQFPFHEWLVTAMTGPTSVSALIHAATMVKAGVYFMLRFMPIFYLASRLAPQALPDYSLFFVAIASIGAFTAFLMASQAIVAREFKLILAFSTASQLGYMFLGAGAAGLIKEFFTGFLATFSHLMSHAIFKASLFLAAGGILHAIESRYMTDAGGLRRYMPLTFLSMLLAALSLSGIPPFMGFWTKDGLLEIVYEAHLLPQYTLGVLTAGLTAFYSTRLVFYTFCREESRHLKEISEEHKVHEAHPIMLYPYLLLAFASLAIGLLWPFISSDLFIAIVKHVIAIEEVPKYIPFHIDLLLTSFSLGMAILGLLVSFSIYIKPRYDGIIYSTMHKSLILSSLRNFLYDRWYINSIYYAIFVKGGRWLSNNLFKWFDKAVIDDFYHIIIPVGTFGAANLFKWFDRVTIDEFYNIRIPISALSAARGLRRWQSGKLNHYLVSFLLGLLFFFIVVLFVVM